MKSGMPTPKPVEEEGLGYDPEEGRAEPTMTEEVEETYVSTPTIIHDRREIVIENLRVNDFVYLSEMGAKGVVKDIDLKNQVVTININLFGRSQTLRCKPQQLKEF